MAYNTSEMHHQFPKLAEESGFSFNTHRSRGYIDWRKIKLIDIENLIREKNFTLIEQHLNDILNCVLESEFDVRILDEGVMKMFRLAQLTVEYQQFCRQYLDRSVYVLREEIISLTKELESTKKEFVEKDEEVRKIRRRMRQTFKTTLPYGNDNIASMILKTLTNKNNIFLPSSNGDAHNYNKCTFCDKVFLNQLYLQSHMTRRHNNILAESLPREEQENQQTETIKLNSEITELKSKLKEMETMILNKNEQGSLKTVDTSKIDTNKDECNHTPVKETKDAEVSTNNDDYIFNKIEEWKKEEQKNYNKEINNLRNQIMDTINSFKENELVKPVQSDNKAVDHLQTTIIQQGAEILALKKELDNYRIKTENENAGMSKQAEAQMLLWTKRAELQSQQYELLLQKFTDLAKSGEQSRALAEIEKGNTQLEPVPQLSKVSEQKSIDVESNKQTPINTDTKNERADRKYLEHLHQKVQELLDIGSTGSSSSDSIEVEKIESSIKKNKESRTEKENNKDTNNRELEPKVNDFYGASNGIPYKAAKTKVRKMKKVKPKLNPKTVIVENTLISCPGSPIKVVRAKLVEEVNNRLVAAGVDPIKNGIPHNIFQKQKRQLQFQQELKSKKISSYENVRHSILTYLDLNTSNIQKEVFSINDPTIQIKSHKPFHNLASVISNVKTKALSLVNIKEGNAKDKRQSLNSKVTKRVMSLLKTPPDSRISSPLNQRHSPVKVHHTNGKTNNSLKTQYSGPNESRTIDVENIKSNLVDLQVNDEDSISNTSESDQNYCNSTSNIQQSSKSIEKLMRSPVQRPTSAYPVKNPSTNKYITDNGDNITEPPTETYVTELKPKLSKVQKKYDENSSNAVELLTGPRLTMAKKEHIKNKTKSVLKNASSISSINKKKVLFDMEAIQMKSVSASPSQSTEKSDGKENYELGIVHLDGEEWDVSSIENEHLKNDTKIQINTRTSPKIAELKQTIESQLARRNLTSTITLVGGVDVLAAGAVQRTASVGGSNTSLGSSILDDSESMPFVNQSAFVTPKKVTQKDDSDVDISEFSIDDVTNKK